MEIESLLHQNPQFEPGAGAKRLWLYCRRKETQIGSPGFLCSPRQWDLALFLLILLLEFIGLYLFYKYVGNLIFAISFFAADVTYAIFAHIVYGSVSVTKNRIYLLHRNVRVHSGKSGQKQPALAREGQIKKERRKLFWLRVYSLSFYVLIALLGVLKIGGFIANWPGRDPINSISITICLTYIVVAVLQIYATGYFAFSSLFYLAVRHNLRKHKNQQSRLYARIDAGHPTTSLYEGIDIHTLLVTDGKFEDLGYRQKEKQRLPSFNNCTVRNHFIQDNRLFLYGVLTDEDLNAFVNNHANNLEAKEILGLIMLDLQLEKCISDGGKDIYTEPIPFPAGHIAGAGAIDRAVQSTSVYSIVRVGNDLVANRQERAGRNWLYEWSLDELAVREDGTLPPTKIPVPDALEKTGDPLSVQVSFSGLNVGQTYYLSVYAKNLAEPYVRGISSPPFPVRIIS